MIDPLNQNSRHLTFTPPPADPIISTKFLASIILNFCTLGAYTALHTVLKQIKVEKLELNQKELAHQADILIQEFENIEGGLAELQVAISEKNSNHADLVSQFKKIKKNVTILSKHDFININAQAHLSISSIAAKVAHFFCVFIINVPTLGIYGIMENHALNYKVSVLQGKEKYLEEQMRVRQFKKIKMLNSQLKEVSEHAELKEQFRILASTDEGNALIQFAALKTKHTKLNEELQQLHTAHAALKTEKEALERVKNRMDEDARACQAQMGNLEREKAQINTRLLDLTQKHETATNQVADFTNRLYIAQNQAAQLRTQLNGAEVQLRQARAVPGQVQLINQLGAIPPKYTKLESDKDVQGDFEIDEEGLYQQRYGSCKVLPELMVAAFDQSFDQLIALSSQEVAGKAKIHFNNSAQIYSDDKFAGNMNAVYRYAILDLIMGARVELADCHGYALRFNDNVTMVPSEPRKVLVKRIDAATKEEIYETQIDFSRIDAFTPSGASLPALGLAHGVDPLSAAWILRNRLTKWEIDVVKTLLLEPLIADNDPVLIAAKAISRQKTDSAKLINTAVELICTMGTNMSNKYQSNVLGARWAEKADEFDDAVVPLLKAEAALDEIEDKPGDLPLTAWDFLSNLEYFDKNQFDDQLAADDKQAYGYLKMSEDARFDVRNKSLQWQLQQAYFTHKTIAEQLTKDKLVHVYEANATTKKLGKTVEALRLLNPQFYVAHEVIDPHYCLLSNMLATFLCSKEMVTKENIQFLRNAMAKLLDKPEMKEKFAAQIASSHTTTIHKNDFMGASSRKEPMSVQDYQAWLRKGAHTCYLPGSFTDYKSINFDITHLGALEIEIFAYVLGMRVAVFVTDQSIKVDEKGLLAPQTQVSYFGPNTKEVLYLLNGNGVSYYGLYPKLKEQPIPKRADFASEDEFERALEAQEATKKAIEYWAEMDKPNG
jgi:hypothetical protein